MIDLLAAQKTNIFVKNKQIYLTKQTNKSGKNKEIYLKRGKCEKVKVVARG